jgi:O-succinylbenzoate synthase
MKIEKVELSLLYLPYVHFFETSLGREEGREFIIVRVHSEGLCGYGEIVASEAPFYSYETTSTAWLVLSKFLIPLLFQKGISRPEDFYGEARRFRGHPMAKAGLELALWDLQAKKAGVPLSRLYGGTRENIEVGVSLGIENSIPELMERIGHFIGEGYRRIKLKIKPGWDVEVVKETRKHFPEILLQVDANGAYSLKDKGALLMLDAFNLLLLEQPFPPYDLWDHSRLQKEMKTPICLDESIITEDTARQALEMGSCRVINIKVGRVGGFVEARKVHDVCRREGIPVWCGGMLESGIGRAHNLHIASLPNFKLPSDLSASKRYYKEDLIDPPIELERDGTIRVPEGPGIGVHPVEERIKRATLRDEAFTLEK